MSSLVAKLVRGNATERRAAAVVVASVVLLVGWALGARNATPAYADACKAPNASCFEATKTSAVVVVHVYDPQGTNQAVEPSTGEDLDITAYWNTNTIPCDEDTETATVRVDWDSATDSWVLSNVNLTTNIVDIDLCAAYTLGCSTLSDGHAYGYKLIVDINDPGPTNHHLRQVVYQTTAVDDGNRLNLGSCTLGVSETVNSQTWTATDAGAFGCNYACTESGATMTIEY